MSNTIDADVIIVGLGPTGLTLASLLGSKGHSVVVVERWPELYGKPRLTHIDGETARLLNHCSDVDHALRDSWVLPHYNWVNSKGHVLFDVAAGNKNTMLWDDHLTVHQPHIEEAILERIEAVENVTLLRGHLATDVTQTSDEVTVLCRPWRRDEDASPSHRPTADNTVVRGKYLVAADGSKSPMRELLGIERKDFGFNERWMCVDTEPVTHLPEKFTKNAVQVCDPARGYMFMPIGLSRQRFEFALLDSESTEEMSTPGAALRLLEQYHGIGADDVDLIRVLVYTFECRLAEQWRRGRAFLAGDAAHTNPPYLGQGACSGMRDASNLAWKFDLVLRGLATDALLDTYQAERLPHAKKLMLDARALGKLANTSSKSVATIRDLIFRFNLAPEPTFPVLTDGVLAKKHTGKLQDGAGTVLRQGRLSKDGLPERLDDITDFSFVLLSRCDVLSGLTPQLRDVMDQIGVRQIVIGPDGLHDDDNVYLPLFEELSAECILVRPDLVMYGHGTSQNAEGLLGRLAQDLGANVPDTGTPASVSH